MLNNTDEDLAKILNSMQGLADTFGADAFNSLGQAAMLSAQGDLISWQIGLATLALVLVVLMVLNIKFFNVINDILGVTILSTIIILLLGIYPLNVRLDLKGESGQYFRPCLKKYAKTLVTLPKSLAVSSGS